MLDLHRQESDIASRKRVVLCNSFSLFCRYLSLFFVLMNSGCQTLSLPAIDPSGNRLFTNTPMQFVRPHDPNNGYASTAPAFQTPPTPPKCGQGDGKKCQGCLSGKGCLFAKKREEEMRGRCGQLLITPNRLVAPVGGEVVILAGVCGKDEYLVTNEAIEYMLDPDGVGQIVEVGDDAKGQRKSFWSTSKEPKVEKLGVDFARGRTSREAGIITKGTADRSDDLPIRKGQTWISLTSPTEGTSKVTILAPDSDVWDKRRQTATIYWIDASWDFPQPQFLSGEQQTTLVTKVMKSDSYVPAEGWIVKYRSLNPEYAEFVFLNAAGAEGLGATASAKVDAQGIASVVLRRKNLGPDGTTNPKSGTALVELEIMRPIIGDMPELPLARSTTSVTWSAPDLVLDAVGPDITSPGQSVQYLLKITNQGDQAAETIIAKATFPTGMRIDGTSFSPQRSTPNSLIWEFGPLQARSVFEVVINVTPISPLDAQVLFELSATGQENQQKPVRTNVQQASLTMQLVPKPNMGQAAIGDQVGFDCVLTNTGSQSINNIQIEIDCDPGLIHEAAGIASTKVKQDVPYLRPGDRTVLDVFFRVQREGELGIVGKATANGQPLANQRSSVRGVAPVPQQPAISLQLTEQSQQRVLTPGVPITIRCIVSNGGAVALRTPVLMLQHDPNFQLQSLDPPQGRYVQGEQMVQWNLNDLQPRQTGLEFRATFIPLGPVRQAILKAEVSSDGLRDGQQLTFEIGNPSPVGAGSPSGSMIPGGSPLPSVPNPGSSLPNALPGTGGLPSTSPPGLPTPGPVSPGPSSSGPGLMGLPGSNARPAIGSGLAATQRLSISIQPSIQLVKRGDTVSYEVLVENLSAQPDQKVAMQFTIPSGSKLITAKAVGLDYMVSRDGTTVAFTPIQFFRARDSFTYTIQLRHEESSSQSIVAAVKSMGQPEPLGTTLVTRVQ